MTRPKSRGNSFPKHVIDPMYNRRQTIQHLNETGYRNGLSGVYKTRFNHELALLRAYPRVSI